MAKKITYNPITGEDVVVEMTQEEIVQSEVVAIWHLADKAIQVFLTHEDSTRMILANPMLPAYMAQNAIIVISEPQGVYIYLNTLFPEHRALFESFNAIITEK